MAVGPDFSKRADSEKNYAHMMVVIGDGFTPDELILQGKSHQIMYLCRRSRRSLGSSTTGKTEMHPGSIRLLLQCHIKSIGYGDH
jgi:hypothetical protein